MRPKLFLSRCGWDGKAFGKGWWTAVAEPETKSKASCPWYCKASEEDQRGQLLLETFIVTPNFQREQPQPLWPCSLGKEAGAHCFGSVHSVNENGWVLWYRQNRQQNYDSPSILLSWDLDWFSLTQGQLCTMLTTACLQIWMLRNPRLNDSCKNKTHFENMHFPSFYYMMGYYYMSFYSVPT